MVLRVGEREEERGGGGKKGEKKGIFAMSAIITMINTSKILHILELLSIKPKESLNYSGKKSISSILKIFSLSSNSNFIMR